MYAREEKLLSRGNWVNQDETSGWYYRRESIAGNWWTDVNLRMELVVWIILKDILICTHVGGC